MPRALARLLAYNLLVLLGFALPLALVSGCLLVRWFPPAWAPEMGREASLRDLFGTVFFWYVLLVIPTLVVGVLHQVLLAALPHDWSAGRTRLAIVGSSLAVGGVTALLMTRGDGGNVSLAVGAIIPAVLVYGVCARPLRPADSGVAVV